MKGIANVTAGTTFRRNLLRLRLTKLGSAHWPMQRRSSVPATITLPASKKLSASHQLTPSARRLLHLKRPRSARAAGLPHLRPQNHPLQSYRSQRNSNSRHSTSCRTIPPLLLRAHCQVSSLAYRHLAPLPSLLGLDVPADMNVHVLAVCSTGARTMRSAPGWRIVRRVASIAWIALLI